jgi:hypothetical protein
VPEDVNRTARGGQQVGAVRVWRALQALDRPSLRSCKQRPKHRMYVRLLARPLARTHARTHARTGVRMCSPTGQGRVTILWSVSRRRDDADARCTAERWPSSLPARMQSPVCDALPNVCQAHKRATAINMPINAEATWGIICGAEAGARVGRVSPACGSTSPSLERGRGGSEAAASQRHVATRARAQQ